MAIDLSQIQALNDFPETAYQDKEVSTSLRFRWIHAQCFQFELPDGKVLMTDPFFPQHHRAWRRGNTPLLNLSELGRVDYITINHSHFDHVGNISDVFRDNSPIVICDRIYARELSNAYSIPEYNIYPIVPGLSYEFESFRLDTVQGKHNDLGSCCDLDGRFGAEPDRPSSGRLNSYGCLFNTNFLYTLNNHFRIGFAAGVDFQTLAEAWKGKGPDLLLRQRMVNADSGSFAEDCLKLGGQLVLPMHQDASSDSNCDMNAFANRVNEEFQRAGSCMRMLNPKRLHWYTVQTSIEII